MKVAVLFLYQSWCHARMVQSMFRYLPGDVEIVYNPPWIGRVQAEPDVVVGHYGAHTFQPWWLFFDKPVGIISELGDEESLHWLAAKRHALFLYDVYRAKAIKEQGYNAIAWPRPVDPLVFYKEKAVEFPGDRDWDILSAGSHEMDYVVRVHRVLQRHKRSHLVLTKAVLPPELSSAACDFCPVAYPHNEQDDRLRGYYNRAKYSMSLRKLIHWRGNATRGFEVANVEAAMCGSVPILLESPESEYIKHWYGDFALFIRESHLEQDLERILKQPYQPLSDKAIEGIKSKFAASAVWTQFWDAVRAIL